MSNQYIWKLLLATTTYKRPRPPEMDSDSFDKYAGIVTSKYPFTRVNSLRIKQATAARSITSSLLSRMVQLIVSQSPCSILKPRKCSKSPPFSNACLVLQTSNSGKRSDAFHSTSENSENLNRWFLLNGKRPKFKFNSSFLLFICFFLRFLRLSLWRRANASKRQLYNSLRWLIYIFNLVDNYLVICQQLLL